MEGQFGPGGEEKQSQLRPSTQSSLGCIYVENGSCLKICSGHTGGLTVTSELCGPSMLFMWNVEVKLSGELSGHFQILSRRKGEVGASQVVLVVKNLTASGGDVRDVSLISAWGRSPGGGHGTPLQYSCLEKLMDRGA